MNTQQAALDYLQRHWSVIPIRRRDKRPAIRWQEFQQRLATVSEVEWWFQHWPESNIGIVTGAVSGLVVLDIDPDHGGEESLQQLLRGHGPLPKTIEALTGSGGRHLYFAHPGETLRNRVGLAPGIDLRADGGCVVAPPSVHPLGVTYRWCRGYSPQEATAAPLPRWLLQLLTDDTRGAEHTLDYWRELLRHGVTEGERNNAIASLCGHLLWHGVDPDVARELLVCWNRVRCRPSLSDEEVAKTVDSISRLHES